MTVPSLGNCRTVKTIYGSVAAKYRNRLEGSIAIALVIITVDYVHSYVRGSLEAPDGMQ